GAALLERPVEGAGGLLDTGLIGSRAAQRCLRPALRDGLRLLADRAHLLAEADVGTRRPVAHELDAARDQAVDGGLERGDVLVVTVPAADQAIALVLRLGDAAIEGVGGLLETRRVDRDALLERLGPAARLGLGLLSGGVDLPLSALARDPGAHAHEGDVVHREELEPGEGAGRDAAGMAARDDDRRGAGSWEGLGHRDARLRDRLRD